MNHAISRLILNSSILSLPGFFSIILSLVSIPIHLKFAGPESYGDYIIFQFVLIISIILNFGISKSIVISINNHTSKNKEIAYEGIKYTLIVISIIISILYIVFYYNNLHEFFRLIPKSLSIYLLFGIGITIFYSSLEGILQGNEKYKTLSFFNFIFYSLALSFPSITLLFNNKLQLEEIIFLSIIIKFISLFLMLLIILKKNLILRSRSHILLINLKKNSKWLTLNNILIHFYDLLDKYLIKLFLGSVALAIYTIPQQLTGKLSIVSKGFSAYLLTKLSRKKNDNEIFNFSLKLFLKIIPIFIFILFPFYEFILKFWLGGQYDRQILLLAKVFSICAIFSCASHLLITKFEASKSLKKNLKIELSFIPFFLILLYFLTSSRYSLIAISFLILFKEVILLILRLTFLKKVIKDLNFFYICILLILLTFYISINFQNLFLIVLMFLIIGNFVKND